MADPDRTAEERLTPAARTTRALVDDALAVELRDGVHRWAFHALLRRLERRHPEVPRFGTARRLEHELPIRFGQDPGLAFPAAELSSWRPGDARAARLGQRFFGLFGSNGPLPLHLTEVAVDRERRHHDPTLRRFADLFHHRLLALLHRAHVQAHPALAADRQDENPFSRWIAALFGQMGDAFADRDAVPDLDKVYFAGILAQQSRHADGLRNLLAELFDVPVRIREFVGEWIHVPDSARIGLGIGRRLGVDSMLGRQFWSTQHKFRVELGPLRYDVFRTLLPDGPMWPRLADAIRNAVGDEFAWDVQLVLDHADVPPFQLGAERRLGWTTVLPGSTRRHLDRVILDQRRFPTGSAARDRRPGAGS